ncbi:hypothetical protein KPL42_17065 [Clostridium gasigenes]|uniref:hypothetical protein n=1 Tax=Clostridium gasigenes TaxID=94869 RepID=UPI001C0C18C5|nr:hypothetical protein [Clostridium gasigenes]MBU3090186.1 hypothetical protein [Clostridium gasigenes]
MEKKFKLASSAEDKFIELFSEVFGPEKTGKLTSSVILPSQRGQVLVKKWIEFNVSSKLICSFFANATVS